MGSGAILREVIAGADLLEQDWGVAADIWSCPSFTELAPRRDGRRALEPAAPEETPRQSWVEQCLAGRQRAGGRRHRLHPALRRADPALRARRYRVLGTDGFGRSDYRKKLRHFFEVDRHWVALAALEACTRTARSASQGRRGDQEIRHRPGEAEPGRGV